MPRFVLYNGTNPNKRGTRGPKPSPKKLLERIALSSLARQLASVRVLACFESWRALREKASGESLCMYICASCPVRMQGELGDSIYRNQCVFASVMHRCTVTDYHA